MFGLTLEKLFVIAIIAAIVIGPQRLPAYAEKLAALVKALRGFAETAKARVADELGPDFDKEEWKKLDPRQFDPRRIVQDALADDDAASGQTALTTSTPAPPVAATLTAPAPTLALRGWQDALLSRVPAPRAPEPLLATEAG